VTPENNPQRPTQQLDYDPIKKMETGPEEPSTPGKASKALGTVTTLAERVQQIPAPRNVSTTGWEISLVQRLPIFPFCR